MQAIQSCISAALLLVMLLMVILLTTAADSSASTIRDDRSDSQYTALANNTHPYGGLILGNGWLGSGTLISPNWVLTAGHVLSGNITFQTSAGTYSVVQQVPYGALDIGLARLSSPITTIEPVSLYSLDFGVEDGQESIILGAGNTGTGITGQQGGTGGTRRAADTYVYANASAWGWGSENLLTWFRSPGNGAANLEGGSTQGDSGGGLLLNVDGEYAIAGVLTQAWSGGSGGSVIGQYDTGGVFVRSAPLNSWITQYATDAVLVGVTPGPDGTWAIDGSGDWNDGANWIGGVVPNANTAIAILGSTITSPRTVFTNSAVTVESIQFGALDDSEATQSYAIAGQGSINLDSNASTPSIDVIDGTHQFQAVVNLLGPTNVSVAASSSLALNNTLNLNGNTLTKTGAGTLSINSQLSGAVGSVAATAGVVNGSGTIGGDLTNSGATVAPGNSPGKLTVAGDYLQTDGSLEIEINGTSADDVSGNRQFDLLSVGGSLTLSGGSLDIVMGFTPTLGDTFDILDFASINLAGATLNLGLPGANMLWDSSQLAFDGSLTVITGLLGDFDADNDVDGDDFLVWQRGFGTTYTATDLADWQGNYGSVGAVTAAATDSAAAVPEPTSASLLIVSLSALVLVSRHWK
jgi:hypothetical protein